MGRELWRTHQCFMRISPYPFDHVECLNTIPVFVLWNFTCKLKYVDSYGSTSSFFLWELCQIESDYWLLIFLYRGWSFSFHTTAIQFTTSWYDYATTLQWVLLWTRTATLASSARWKFCAVFTTTARCSSSTNCANR